MNYLFGRIKFTNKGFLSVSENEIFTNSSLELKVSRIPIFNSSQRGYFYDPENKVLVAMVGYITNLEEIKFKYGISSENDVEIIADCYVCSKLVFIGELEGIFNVFIYDEKIGKGYIFQDRYGSNLPFYYYLSSDECVFSTSLKILLRNVDLSRQVDINAAYDFLYYRFLYWGNIIPNKTTLIKNIYKLCLQELGEIDSVGKIINTNSIGLKVREVPFVDAKHGLISSISDSIKNISSQVKREEDIYLVLSSGFDTNFILHNLWKIRNNNIKAFTIGGKDKNEIPQVKKIVSHYPGISHYNKIIGQEIIDSFPDIVWKLEGNVFEVGVFLQYELARQVSAAGGNAIFMGEGADQQLNFLIYDIMPRIDQSVTLSFITKLYQIYLKKRQLSELRVFKLFNFLRKRASKNINFDIKIEYILKKNGIMLNHFNIQPLYPFMDSEIQAMARPLGLLNYQKNFYKSELRKILPQEIVKHLHKIGGDTDIDYLFYSKRQEITKTVISSPLVNTLLTNGLIREISGGSKSYNYFILLLLYLCVFEKLFVSGLYDSYLDNNNLNIPLFNFY